MYRLRLAHTAGVAEGPHMAVPSAHLLLPTFVFNVDSNRRILRFVFS